jgi:thymidylate kinase
LKARKIFRVLFGKKKTPVTSLMPEKTKKKRLETATRQRPIVKLTLARTIGYLWRIAVLRIFLTTQLCRKIVIIDRFFYDSFVHYSLTSRRERFYLMILKKALPVPSLALMLIARPRAILQRRPHYDREYVYQLYRHYKQITREFSHLIVVKTDSFKNLAAIITQYLRQAVAGRGDADTLQREVLQ